MQFPAPRQVLRDISRRLTGENSEFLQTLGFYTVFLRSGNDTLLPPRIEHEFHGFPIEELSPPSEVLRDISRRPLPSTAFLNLV